MDITNKQIVVMRMSSDSMANSTVVLAELYVPIADDARRMTDQIELRVPGSFMYPQDPELLQAIAQRLLEI